MGSIKTFRDLIAWQRAMALARGVYQVSKAMPEEERFGLTSQMRRSAVSVPSNIAEGYAQQRTASYIRFLCIARGALAELATQMELATSLGMVPTNQRVTELMRETDRVLQALIRSLERKPANT